MMRLSSVIIFGIGALMGSFATYFYCEKKFERILEEKAASSGLAVKEEEYEEPENPQEENSENVDTPEDVLKLEEERVNRAIEKNRAEYQMAVERERDEVLDLYQDLLADHGYYNEYEDLILNIDKVEVNPNPRPPYVIPINMLDDDEYPVIQTVYYSDGVLADDNEDPIDNWQSLIGSMENLEGFDIPGNDEIYIRNERLHVDVEVLRDLEAFSNIRRKYTWREE